MKISQNGINKIKEWEGFKNEVYLDSAGLPTIGVGHLLTKDELSSGKIYLSRGFVRYLNGLSDESIEELLNINLDRFEFSVNTFVVVDISQNQYDALVSFAFNVGVYAFRYSTLVKKLNQSEYDEVPTQLKRWNISGGKVVQGLINRREKEIELWNS